MYRRGIAVHIDVAQIGANTARILIEDVFGTPLAIRKTVDNGGGNRQTCGIVLDKRGFAAVGDAFIVHGGDRPFQASACGIAEVVKARAAPLEGVGKGGVTVVRGNRAVARSLNAFASPCVERKAVQVFLRKARILKADITSV